MIKKLIVCDRCGSYIEEEHPDRITLGSYTEAKTDYGRNYKSYRTTRTIHLCENCKKAFDEFMMHKR